ncbi:hypothetical protein CVT26_010065 [Gymnopilus dilepis]|uniref:DNA endonuclease activator Ctp1 C-terminal domain-containing protein n=1 Tax=Gymnopilus dilepis TaxID=231916 RepID=A0A409WUV6_9AGAR|nr:hypothetical protein CVT26_010065 [Gymnopilus dilepis]
MATTYSGSSLRERDQIIHEKYQKEIRDLELKIQRIRYTADETSKQLFDSHNRGRRLAESLGFQDTYDAQVAIDASDSKLTYRECLDRIKELEAELSSEKKEVQLLHCKLRNAERDNKRLTLEKRNLEARYDDLLDKKTRATEEFKKNYKKWYLANIWLFGGQLESDPGKTAKQIYGDKLAAKQKEAIEFGGGPDLPDGIVDFVVEILFSDHIASIDYETAIRTRHTSPRKAGTPKARVPSIDKENEGTPRPVVKELKTEVFSQPMALLSPGQRTPRMPLRDSLLTSVSNVIAPSASPTIFLSRSTYAAADPPPLSTSTTRVALSLKAVNAHADTAEEASQITSPIDTRSSNILLSSSPSIPRKLNHSSDTEDDSQGIGAHILTSQRVLIPAALLVPSTNPRTGKPVFFKVPAPPPTAGPSRLANTTLNTPQSELPSRPLLSQSEPGPRRTAVLAENVRRKEPPQLSEHDRESGRPSKMRRISENPYDRPGDLSRAKPSSTASEPRPSASDAVLARTGKGRASADDSTPLATKNKGKRPLEDYSAFKGRGRYGKAAQDDNATEELLINMMRWCVTETKDASWTLVTVNAVERWIVLKFVLRHTDHCSYPVQYYENVGPLPNRLQQPLWRSPTSSPSKRCPRHGASAGRDRVDNRTSPSTSRAARRLSDIESHKKTISRHRHTWARAATPPGYWEIGFPNTQEVGNINEKAEEMHKRKKEEIEREAARAGGRYRRKFSSY